METFSALLAFVRGIHRSPVNSPHKGQWRGALMFTLICARINGWVNNREAGDLRRYRAHYDVSVMGTSVPRMNLLRLNEDASILKRRPLHDYVIKWKHFPRYWPFVRGIHQSPVNSPHKGQWPGALTFSLICAWTNGCVNSRDAGDSKRHRTHYDVIVMFQLACQAII